MSRPPTFREKWHAHNDREKKLDAVSRAVSLHLDGWSTSTCTAVLDRREDELDLSFLEAWRQQLDYYEHGIIPPTSDRKSKRKLHDAADIRPQDNLSDYSG